MRTLRPVWLAFLWFLVSGLFFEAAAQAIPGFKIRYTCAEGRFKVRYGGENGPWHYCYDKTYYTDKTIPPDIRAFFDDMDARLASVEAKFSSPEYQQRRAESKANMEALRQSAHPLSPRGLRAPSTSAAGIEASAKPEAQPLAPETLKALAPGSSAADIVAALGDPPGKVSTGDHAESWTYVLTTGAFAKLRLEDGKLKSVELP